MEILGWTVLFLVSLVILSKSADYFNESAEAIGLSLKIPKLTIGILILAIGTSLPELISSVIAVTKGSSEIVFGNVSGSNITNIFFIVGLSAALYNQSIRLELQFIQIDLQFLMASSLFIFITCLDGNFTMGEGLLCLIAYVIYLFYLVANISFRAALITTGETASVSPVKYYFILPASLVGLYFGGNWTIQSVIELSNYLSIGKEVIASSAIAIGTSLPELFVTLGAVKQGKNEMAIGNILGSCIFNAFVVMGLSSLFGNLVISPSIMYTCLYFLLIATVIFFIIIRDKRINTWEAYLFILFYVLFLVKLFNLF
jgi:cation:H+ antiporter